MSVQTRWENNILSMLSMVPFTHYIYNNGVVIATGKIASDYPEHTAPEGMPLWTFVYSDKVVFWVKGTPPGSSNEQLYQVISHSDGTVTRKISSSNSIPEMTEYAIEGTATGLKEICYSNSKTEISALYPDLNLPIDNDNNVYRWTVYFQDNIATSIVAYTES
jgi:hypothetical protein